MLCPRCQQENPPLAKFCVECGARLGPACAACGTELPAGAKFCPSCGRAIGGPGEAGARPQAPTAPSPGAYTPRHLAEKILTVRAAVEGERKPVTVLFCDLVNSTALAERLGPEGMHGLLTHFFEAALAEVHRYEGTINQFLGDGFMALFGAPIAHEDHARRAVLAGLGIARTVRRRPVTVEAAGEVRLNVRMGLHTGFVVVGAIGDNLRMDYTAVGDTTHLAARLQQHAEPGTILVSDATARLVEGYVELEALAPLTVKGKTEPVSAFRVVGLGKRRSSLEGREQRALSRFVGRERELAALRDVLARVERGQGQVVGIVGEPGVGKSRLLLELRRSLPPDRVTYLEARCLSFGSTIPYLPVIDLVRSTCGIVETDSPETTEEKVRLGLREVDLDPDEGAPYLLSLLGVKDSEDRPGTQSPEAIKAGTFEMLRQMSLLSGRRRPSVIQIEDLHWVDRTSEEYFAFLTEGLAGAPILLLGTYRPGYQPPWMDKSFATQLSLSRLAPVDSLSIVRSVLPEARFADSLADLILAKAEGNPFFLEELARAVGDQGGLRAGLTVPDTVHGVLMARIDRLSEEPKRVIQTASVLGREFSSRLLEAVWVGPSALEAHLRELTRLEFLFERTTGDEPVYVFKHALTQDVAQATLLAPRRRELHRRTAEALQAVYPERLGELSPVLAHHYGEAEAWSLAAEHARRAAEAARAVYANREALARYDQALAAAERAGVAAGTRLELHEARGDVHAVLGAFEPARADLEAAQALARETGDRPAEARVLGALGMLWGGHKDYQRGLELTQQAVELIESSGDRRALGEARARVGIMRVNLAQMTESRRELERALALFREGVDAAGEARVLDALAMVTFVLGDLDQSVRHAEEAIPRLRALGDRQTEASCVVTLGTALGYRGDWPAAEPWIRQGLELAVAIGARSAQSFAHWTTGELLETFGSYGPALGEAETGLAIAREIGHLEWTAAGLATVGRIRRECGDVVGARRLHQEMLDTTRQLGTVLWISDALGELGQDLAAAGDGTAAAEYLVRAVEFAGEARKHTVRSLLGQGALALRRGRPAEGLALARRVQEVDAQFGVFVADARRLEGEALATLGQPDEAEAVLRRAKAEATMLGARPPRWRACLALAGLLEGAGRHAEAASERAEALTLLDRVMEELADPQLRRSFEASEPMRRARNDRG